jgi:putative peptidoglycan lipid II flippase
VGGSGQGSDGGLASRLFTAATLLAASAVLSRVLGVGREAIMSRLLGVSPEVDAYRAAFFLPDLLFHFLAGGAISVPFIPLYTRARGRGDAAAADVLAVVLGTTTVLAAVATLVLWLAADSLVPWIFAEFPPDTQRLAVRLTRIVLPAQLCFIAGGVIRGALMARGRFASQAVAPLVYNVGIIAGGLVLGPRLGAEGFAWGTLFGAIAGPLLTAVVEAARTPGISLRMRVAPRDPAFREYLLLALPLMLGVSLFVVDEWYDRYFGQFAGPGAMAALGYARLLLQLPVGVIGQALATAALPFLAQLWSEGRREALDALLLDALRAGLALGVLAGAAYLVLAEPIVGLLYQGGRFGPEQTTMVATLLRIFAFAVPAFVVQQIAVRAFHAREDMWRPMFLGSAVALAAIVLYAEFGARFGAPGLAGAGAIGMSVNALATLWLARRLHGAPDLRALATSGLRSLVVGAAAGGAAALVPAPAISGVAGHALHLLLAGTVFAGVALAATFTVGDPPLRALVARILRRLRRGGG